jgi:hypothetical protein
MEDFEIFDKNGIALDQFHVYGTPIDGPILYINEEKLTKPIIEQIRNYLNHKEKSIKK